MNDNATKSETKSSAARSGENVVHRVIGTAGHIDHGKTSLVRALTGTDCDRLPEEKKRGITIELGFASMRLGDDEGDAEGAGGPTVVASVIDVPGHEKFVRTMVAGAAGMDLVLIVVAADDGVMPQTQEHLAIAEFLGVHQAIVALTKSDLVDDEMRDLVAEDVRDTLAGTPFAEAPIVPCSSITGDGLDALRALLLERLRALPDRRSGGPVVFPIDRCFSRAGFGTVVTGTLMSGEIVVGQNLDLLPGPRGEIRQGQSVRGLQVHGESVERVGCGRRVAVNLRGIDPGDISRGDVLTSVDLTRPTQNLLVEIRVLDTAKAIEERCSTGLHLGTRETLARVSPLGTAALQPGETGFARVVLDEPAVAFADQRLVLRKPGAHGQGTIAGGRVLDAHPTSSKGAFKRWSLLAPRLASADLGERVAALVEDGRDRGVELSALLHRLPLDVDPQAVRAIAQDSDALVLHDLDGKEHVLPTSSVRETEKAILAFLAEFHAARVLLGGAPTTDLGTRLGRFLGPLVPGAIASLERQALVVVKGALVRLSTFDNRTGPSGEILNHISARYLAARFAPPTDEEIRKEFSLSEAEVRDVLSELKNSDEIARLAPTLHFAQAVLDQLSTGLRAHFGGGADAGGSDEISTTEFKELAGGVSRKFAIPLLEWSDKAGLTKRTGDARMAGRHL